MDLPTREKVFRRGSGHVDTVGVSGSNPLSRTIFLDASMMSRFTIFVMAMGSFVGLAHCLIAREPAALPSNTKKKAGAIFAPVPKYGPGWPVGSSLLILHVDEKTGNVVSVEVTKSTGCKMLDDSAVDAFKKWRFW